MLSTILRYQGETVTHRLLNLLRKSVLVSVFASCLLTTARAQLTEPSAQAVRETVQAQLAAFAADDADLAFSYAAPVIRDMFQTPEKFMAMVQQTYPVVYRPAKVLFLAAKAANWACTVSLTACALASVSCARAVVSKHDANTETRTLFRNKLSRRCVTVSP